MANIDLLILKQSLLILLKFIFLLQYISSTYEFKTEKLRVYMGRMGFGPKRLCRTDCIDAMNAEPTALML